MKKKWYVISACVVLLILVVIYQVYDNLLQRIMYNQSVTQLDAIYTQVSKTFYSIVSNNWKLLDSWDVHLDGLKTEDLDDAVRGYLATKQDEWEFENFYFMDEEGNYLDMHGNTGTVDLGRKMTTLIDRKSPVVVDASFSDGEIATFYAIPIGNKRMDGFAYCAIGCTYSEDSMVQQLAFDAFSGEANCYIVNSEDGWIVFSSNSRGKSAQDIISFLGEAAEFEDGALDALAQGLQAEERGDMEYLRDGKPYYLVYMPIGFRDWMLVGTVPQAVISENFDQMQAMTIVMLVIIFVCVAIYGVILIVRANRRKLDEKSVDIQYREELFGILVNTVNDIFLMFSTKDDGFVVEYVSPNIDPLLGMPVAEVREDIHKLEELFVDGGHSAQLTDWIATMDEVSPKAFRPQEEKQLRNCRTRETRWYNETLYHSAISGREKYILVLSDRTDEKAQRMALEEALEIAKSANEAKSNFLFNMSHDIRTPMNAIVGYSTLLRKEADNPDKVRSYVNKISASSQHLLSLINDILDMSKIESGNTKLNIMEFNLSDLLAEINAVIMPQAKAKGQTFELRTLSLRNDVLMGDKTRLSQILINLLSNAVKYTLEGGNIWLEIEEQNNENDRYAKFIFRVKDNGIGMSEEFLKTLYDPFVRARNSTVSKIQGTGLGMAITKNLVALMGGTIAVESKLNQGTTFTVNIDFRVSEQQADPEFWQKHDIRRILAVDDEEDICIGIRDAMEGTGVEVDYATNGSDAVDKLIDAHKAGEGYDVVLVDWKMPDFDGVKTTSQIRDYIGFDLPILVLSAYDWEDIEDEARSAGIDAFLAKPFFVSSFQNTMAQLYAHGGDDDGENEAALEGLHFLVAEDNEINADLLTELLEDEGASSDVASNGREAVEMFEASAPGTYDMILMDVQMPIMDGYEAVRLIRASSHPQAQAIPIAAMTANAFAEDVANALEAGMDAHIAKPVNMHVIKATVARLVRKS